MYGRIGVSANPRASITPTLPGVSTVPISRGERVLPEVRVKRLGKVL
jgi:hypothetical protein